MNTISELEKTKIVYAHFTLEEWKIIAQALVCASANFGDPHDPKIEALLVKFPSAAL